MKPSNNRIVLDLNKCQWAKFWYVNQYGDTSAHFPSFETVQGKYVGDEYARNHPDYPCETMKERARRLDIVDKWIPVCIFQLAANHNVTYTGDKAKVMWKAWNEKIFNKKGKK